MAALVLLAFLAGFWPQHRALVESQAAAASLQAALDATEARIRLGRILGQLLRLSDAVTLKNYGETATLSSAYFDSVRQKVSRSEAMESVAALNSILQSRDRVTTAIASADATLSEHEQSAAGTGISDNHSVLTRATLKDCASRMKRQKLADSGLRRHAR